MYFTSGFFISGILLAGSYGCSHFFGGFLPFLSTFLSSLRTMVGTSGPCFLYISCPSS